MKVKTLTSGCILGSFICWAIAYNSIGEAFWGLGTLLFGLGIGVALGAEANEQEHKDRAKK